MTKLENPYSKTLDEIKECLSLHKIEFSRITNEALETKLEEKVKKYVNDPRVAEIRSQKKISEDDQGYLDINIFLSTFYKKKWDLSKEYDKEYKKFLSLADEYKDFIQQRITQFEVNASLLGKFTEEEIKTNPKLSKMMKEAPAGFDEAKKKFTKADIELSKMYVDYMSRTGQEYSKELYDFLNESKQFRKQFMANKQAELEELKVKKETAQNQPNSQNTQEIPHNFGEIKEFILQNSNISNDQMIELKRLLSKEFTPNQLAELNSFEETIRNEYANSMSSDSIIKKRLDKSLTQFLKGVDKISDLIIETGTSRGLFESFNGIKEELFSKPVDEVKKDSAYINLLIGYCCGIKKYLSENNTKKGFFKKVDSGVESLLKAHDEVTSYLINRITVDEALLGNNMLGTMITNDKLEELSYSLMNNASRISNESDITDWESEVNKIVTLCVSNMISLIEEGKSPTQAVLKFKEQYLSKEETIDESSSEVEKRRERTHVLQNDQASKIKRILQ